jgi:nucleoside-diphosphate-sugar epimerase
VPIDEAHPLQAQSPYAATKIGADELALSFHRAFATPVTVVRPFNTFGPRQSARAVIPTIITQLAAGRRSLALGNLEPTRDFNYVEDVVRAFLAAAAAPRAVGETINFGTGFEISIGDVARLIAEVMGVPVAFERAEERMRPATSEVYRLCADNRKAKALTGWEPQFAGRDGLRAGLERTIAWFTDPANLALYKPELYHL